MRDWVAANTPTPASDREEVAGPASSSKTASAEMPPVQLEEAVMEAAEHAIVVAPEKVDAKEPKMSRKAPKR